MEVSLGASPSRFVRGQMAALGRWAELSPLVSERATAICALLAGGAPERSAADGLPFQWRLYFGAGQRSVGFLCEGGVPGEPPERRFMGSAARLEQACELAGIPYPEWLPELVFPNVLPEPGAWPAHWRTGLWFTVEASRGGVRIAPCFNLNRGAPATRWGRVASILSLLGRTEAMQRLNELSGRAPAGSSPAGLAIELLPSGAAGCVQVYFQAPSVRADWLQRWYTVTGAVQESAAVRRLLDAFPWTGRRPYPDRAFVLCLELHGDGGRISLDTDLAVTTWSPDDVSIMRGVRGLMAALELDTREPLSALESIGGWPPPQGRGHFLYVGLGRELGGGPRVRLSFHPPRWTSPVRRPPVPSRGARMALGDGLSFLFSTRRDGHWTDFALPAGEVDRWVTAHVLFRLGRLPQVLLDRGMRRQIDESLDWLLESRGPSGGWGYNRTTGDDADSTSLAILALRRHGRSVPREALESLRRCQTGDGGMATYPRENLLGGSWTASVPDVTALALAAMGDELSGSQRRAAEGFLQSRQLPGGLWPSFWWLTPLYATWAVLELWATGKRFRLLPAQLRQTLRGYAPASSFEVSLLLLCQAHLGVTPRPEGLARRLLAEQQADGSWEPSAYLRLPPPRVGEPWNTIDAGPAFVDRRAIFTTATVLEALAGLHAARVSSGRGPEAVGT